MKRYIKKYTYRNLCIIANKIMKKGYDSDEAYLLAKLKFADFNPKGMPIERMVDNMLTKEEFEKQQKEYGA